MKNSMKKYFNRKTAGILFFAVILAAAVAYYFLIFSHDSGTSSQLEEARELYAQREYSESLEKYKSAINANHKLTDAYLEGSEILSTKHRYDDAIDFLSKGIGFANDEAAINSKIAWNYSQKTDFEKAYEFSSKASKLSDKPQYHKETAGYLALLGRFDEAKAEAGGVTASGADGNYYKAILSYTDIKKAREYADKSVSFSQDSKYKRMVDILNSLEETDDNKIVNYTKIAKTAIDDGEGPIALIPLNDAKKENQYYEGSYIYEAYVYISYQDFDNAAQLLKTAETYAPKNKDVPVLLAETYYKSNDLDKASSYIAKAFSYSTITDKTRELGYLIYSAKEDYKNALAQVDALLQNSPAEFKYAKYKAQTLNDSADYSSTKTYLEGYLGQNSSSLTPEQLTILKSLEAYAGYNIGEKKLAKDELDEAYASYPNNAEVNYYFGVFYAGQSDPEIAKNYFDRAIELDSAGEITKLAEAALKSL